MMAQTVVSGLVVFVALTGVFSAVGNLVDKKTGIEVHSLEYSSGHVPEILQSRTVTANGSLVARWSAEIQGLQGLQWVRVCKGGDFWEYDAGSNVYAIPFDQWVGQTGCYKKVADMPSLRACATYEWSDSGRTNKCSEPFTIRETE